MPLCILQLRTPVYTKDCNFTKLENHFENGEQFR